MRGLLNRYRQSIALHLLTVIFGFYFLVAVLVTVIQLYKEYENTKKEFYEEIQTLPATFGKGISDSVWTYSGAATLDFTGHVQPSHRGGG